MSKQLPAKVVKRDQELQRSSEELHKLRWHWTLDQTNPDRINFSEYSRQVGVGKESIRRSAMAWVSYVTEVNDWDIPVKHSLADHAEMAGRKVEEIEAAEALAAEMGTNVANVLGNKKDTVKDTVRIAAEAAERKGTTISEELPRVAEFKVKAEKSAKAERKRKTEREDDHSARYLMMEGHLAAVTRALKAALAEAERVNFTDEEIGLLTDSLRRVRVLLGMVDMRIIGQTDIDWDAELAALGDPT